MKYITRWSLMHSTRAESLSEHTCDTALLAHILCLIARRYTGTPCRPKTVAVAALYHDAPEIITGDLPTPVKYHSATLRDAYKAMERESVASMTAMLPDELAEEVAPFLTGELLTAEETKLLKAADRLSALVKCLEEQRSGNHEFDAALAQQKAASINTRMYVIHFPIFLRTYHLKIHVGYIAGRLCWDSCVMTGYIILTLRAWTAVFICMSMELWLRIARCLTLRVRWISHGIYTMEKIIWPCWR